jgi:hypothetical protein
VALVSSGTGSGPGWGKGDGQEGMERLEFLARGPQGEQGETGETGKRGERGLSWRVRWAIVVLFVLAIVPGAAGVALVVHEADVNAAAQRQQQAAQQRAAAAEHAAQQRAGAVIVARLCLSLEPLEGLAQLKPPAGNAHDNPSRAYEQQLSARLAPLAQLGPDLGCKP